MNTREDVKATGFVRYRLFGKNGELKKSWEANNLVVTAGKNHLASWLAALSQANPFASYVAVGTGSTAPALTDTALATELTRVQGVLTSLNNIWSNVALFGPGVATGALQESGLFQNASGAPLFARQVFPVVNKDATDTLEVSWQVTIS